MVVEWMSIDGIGREGTMGTGDAATMRNVSRSVRAVMVECVSLG